MTEAGIQTRGVEEHAHFPSSFSDVSTIEIDPDIGAIVVGMDIKITYTKMAYALLHLQSNPSCLLVGTNSDNTFPSSNDRVLPGGGTMVKMMEYCSEKTPIIVGKPNNWFLDRIIDTYKLNRDRTVMVGDKLSTDILFGNNGKIQTLLVFTGVTSPELLNSPVQNSDSIFPTWTSPSLPHVQQLFYSNQQK